jgi:CRISPR-associated protein Cmr3
MMRRLLIDPADDFIVRDGKPFNQDDAGRAINASRFPPPPDTIYGAVRAGLARANGWSGLGDWSGDEALTAALGAWGNPGTLRIAGPYFSFGGIALLPLPANLVALEDRSTGHVIGIQYLSPGAPISTDAGQIRLLNAPTRQGNVSDHKLGERYAPAAVVQALLNGEAIQPTMLVVRPSSQQPLPDQCVRLDQIGIGHAQLAAQEPRIGLERDSKSRQAVDGRLYSQVRRSLRRGVTMYADVFVDGLDLTAEQVVPFGGEARFAFLQCNVPVAEESRKTVGAAYTVLLTTPALLPPPQSGQTVGALPGVLVMAALPTPIVSTAGFERGGGHKGLGKAATVLPPGTLFFMAGSGPLPSAIGDRTERGYGQFITGVWRDG